MHIFYIIGTNNPEEQSRSTKTKYLYIPYVINHGYDMKETTKGDNEDFMVGHELARITIPIIDDLDSIVAMQDRSGKSLSESKNMNPNEIISLVENLNIQSVLETNDEGSGDTVLETAESNSKGDGSYSYIDTNGDLKTTKDISEVAVFGFKTFSLNTPQNIIEAPVASKLCGPANKLRTSNVKTTTGNSRGICYKYFKKSEIMSFVFK